MDSEDLDRLLGELRAFRTDHQFVEAKRAQDRLPETVYESASAFANTDGGTILLGVHENNGSFDVTGVDAPDAMANALQNACVELEPPLRPRIYPIEHSSGRVVIAAEIQPVPRAQRPCHRRVDGPHAGSYVRVHDADRQLTSAEVDEMLAARQANVDHSARQAPDGAELDAEQVRGFAEKVRAQSGRAPENDDELLRRWRLLADGKPTIAGLLTMGVEPAASSPMARVAYRVDPPEGSSARYTSDHFEGTVGEILDRASERLARDLNPAQVFRDGGLYDQPDFPPEALREVISNALMHRSMTPATEVSPAAIRVHKAAVVISSPGGLHVGGELAQLGLTTFSGVRNLTLVRASQMLRTPSGARIVENQASGIPAADNACRAGNAMPVLFVDRPAQFDAVCLRGVLDDSQARRLLQGTSLEGDPDAGRIVCVALGMRTLTEDEPWTLAARTPFDVRFAARALANETSPEDAAVLLVELQRAGVLARRGSRLARFWSLPSSTDDEPSSIDLRESPSTDERVRLAMKRANGDRVDELLIAIAESEADSLRSGELGVLLELNSRRSIAKWIGRALEKKLIEPTSDKDHDPTRGYLLTRSGKARVRHLQS